MRSHLLSLLFLISLLSSCLPEKSSIKYAPQHPLDPLSNAEFKQIQQVLREAGHFTEKTWLAQISLQEPPKDYVRNWEKGQSLQRAAFVVVRKDFKTYEAVIDLEADSLSRWTYFENAQPNLINREFRVMENLIRAYEPWQEAMKRRGVTDLDSVFVDAQFAGYFGDKEGDYDQEFRRLGQVITFDLRRAKNFYGRPIEGVTAIIDLETEEIVKFTDPEEIIPIPDGDVDFDNVSAGESRDIPTTLGFSQPDGPSFTLDGHTVSWQNWSFHHRIDPRVGLIVSQVKYMDHGKNREMIYQSNMSELFVPYQDPADGWYQRTFLDAAEYSAGGLVYGLKPNRDCPANAVYFDSEVADDRGNPRTRRRVACLFERPTGNPSWRHSHAMDGKIESRRQRELVMRMIAVVGNYDYAIDWIFAQDGTVTIGVGATGVASVKAVKSRTALDDSTGEDGRYGHFVAPNTVAVNHGHFFNFRIDLDVDGPANSMNFVALKTVDLGESAGRRSIWNIESTIPKTELDARANMNIMKPKMWRFINPNVQGPVGYPSSIAIMPHGAAMPLQLPQDYGQRRGAFTEYNFWVTPYNKDEMYAGGKYPAQSSGRMGLPAWTAQNRNIENTDIVAWYNLSFHHVVRAEDWPVMPTMWHSISIMPFDFFDRNPAIDLPN